MEVLALVLAFPVLGISSTGTGTDSTDIGTRGTGNDDTARLVCTIP